MTDLVDYPLVEEAVVYESEYTAEFNHNLNLYLSQGYRIQASGRIGFGWGTMSSVNKWWAILTRPKP